MFITKSDNWWEIIKPKCCENCGNYETFIGSTNQEHPQSIRCWKHETGDCRHNPNKATYAQMRRRAILVRNPEIGKECPVCLNPMKGPYVRKIFCGHTFHHKCLKKWEEIKMSCPMCRYEYGEGPSVARLLEEYEEAVQEFKSDFCFFKFVLQSDSDDDDELKDTFIDLTDSFYDLIATHTAYYKRTRQIHPTYRRNVNRYFWAIEKVETPISSD